ncbi:MAG: YifB family Mg chelatase-like AAA ATPase [Magnetococcales bacterium]|nr:YifB family Mg chelatase-like AAA ATPase [Magnetococcales bacterium]
MSAQVHTIALEGVVARPVEVEVDLHRGLPHVNVVGLPDGAVREAKDRVRAALANSGFALPPRRVTINLAPADLPKEGSGYDLPIAVALLVAMDVVSQDAVNRRLLLGELALDGRLKPVPGCLPAAIRARDDPQMDELVVPADNSAEAALVPGVTVVAPRTVTELVQHLTGATPLPAVPTTAWQHWLGQDDDSVPDLAHVKGQEHAKRALEIIAAGGHNLLMSGPPGSGKTLLSRCLPKILPELSLEEALEVTAIYSVAGKLSGERPVIGVRPFRAPHHTASQVALIGGGSIPRPGEVSLSHRGILFLDELPEFGRSVLEVLREPMESGGVTISRAARSAWFPAQFQLIAACNPCPCGHLGDPYHACQCPAVQVDRYRSRLSGPLLDRIDLHVEVPPVPVEQLVAMPSGEASAVVRQRVVQARARQQRRNGANRLNAHLAGDELAEHTRVDQEGESLLLLASRRMGFSARTYHRILKVARTLADLAGDKEIAVVHLAEAIQYRVNRQFTVE